MAVKLPHNFAVCQKTLGNSSRDLYAGGGSKTPAFCIRTAIKSQTKPCKCWKSLTSPWETITIRIKEQEKYQSWQKSDCIGIFLTIYLPNYLQSKQHTYQTHYWQTKTAYLQKYFLLTHLTKGGIAEQMIKLDSLHHFLHLFLILFSSLSLRENAENMYCFSSLALTLNEEEEGVCWTDSRLRPDQRLMEAGRWDEANVEKQRLEEKQRATRRRREAEASKAIDEGERRSKVTQDGHISVTFCRCRSFENHETRGVIFIAAKAESKM